MSDKRECFNGNEKSKYSTTSNMLIEGEAIMDSMKQNMVKIVITIGILVVGFFFLKSKGLIPQDNQEIATSEVEPDEIEQIDEQIVAQNCKNKIVEVPKIVYKDRVVYRDKIVKVPEVVYRDRPQKDTVKHNSVSFEGTIDVPGIGVIGCVTKQGGHRTVGSIPYGHTVNCRRHTNEYYKGDKFVREELVKIVSTISIHDPGAADSSIIPMIKELLTGNRRL